MKTRLCLCLLVLTVATVILPVQAQEHEDRSEIRVAFISDEPSARDDEFRTLIQEELLELTRNDFDVQFPDAYNMVGDGTAATIAQAVDQLLRGEQVDLVLQRQLATAGPMRNPQANGIGVMAAACGTTSSTRSCRTLRTASPTRERTSSVASDSCSDSVTDRPGSNDHEVCLLLNPITT